ncbi:GAP family protein [Microbacterium deminutum]|uniref:GAP family protein n=1 Tax=Microbacterium deminutum TaxID=344164 RepID=A0ABP5CS56_9MICO
MQAIGHVLPIALAVALSSVPIMVTIYILLSPNRSRSALPFAIGWVVGLFAIVSVCALAAQLVPTPRGPRRPETAVGIIEILVGLALIVLGILSFRRARRAAAPAVPKFLDSKRALGPWKSFGLAFILNLRPKGLLLAIAAGLTIRGDTESLTEALIVIGIYTVIAASTVVVPIIATLAAPARMEPRLASAREWLVRNGEAMTGLIVVLIGVVIVGMGLARL